MKFNSIAFGALLASTAMNLGCGDDGPSCTEIGCVNSYTLILEAPGTAFAAGNYNFTVTFDGAIVDDCVVLISDNDAECGTAPCILQNTCETVDGVDNQLKELQVTNLNVEGELPSTVVLSLARDGVGLAERTFTPQYEESYPNGEECDATPCLQAEERFTLPN